MPGTREDLRGRARVLADQDEADFPTDAQYNQYLDAARREVWYDLVVAGWPVDFTTQSITANGSTSYSLASGAEILGVREVRCVQGGVRTPLRRIDESSRAAVLSAPTTAEYARYEVVVTTTGTALRLYPATTAGTFEVDYTPAVVDWADDGTDEWHGPWRSDELIVLRAAAKGCRKEGRRGDAADLLQDYKELLEKVITTASWVDMRNTARIRDVNSVGRHPFDYPVDGPERY